MGNSTEERSGRGLQDWLAGRNAPNEFSAGLGQRNLSDCRYPRLATGDPESGVYHLSPNRVEVRPLQRYQPGLDHCCFAPYPHGIVGLREHHLDEARSKHHVLLLGKLKNGRSLGDDGIQTYQLLDQVSVPAEPADEECYDA